MPALACVLTDMLPRHH